MIMRNIANLSRLRLQMAQQRTLQERLADAITSISGRMRFVYLHIVWFGAWIVISTFVRGLPHMSIVTRIPARRLALVADDEIVIQILVARVMRQFGLIALVVGDGAAAIAAVEAHRDDLACAVLDVVMPIVNGVDAAHTIQRIAPDLAIVLMSGAVPAHCIEPLKRLRLAGMLHKPFLLAELRELVRQAIGGAVVIEPA